MTPTLPFRAALFDLDGTLLDSMHIWHDVDARFFSVRGMAVPPDYSRAIQGMSFTECAEYTVRRFGLPESPEEIAAEWMSLTADAYAHEAPLKPGALRYLRMLKRAGVKLAVATSNRPEVFGPALEVGGALELFDAVCTTGEVGHQGKRTGAVYRLAAERLEVEPADCAVFEDVLDGIQGAKVLGMRAYALRDPASAHDRDAIAALADGVVDDFDGMRAFHPFPDNARRCLIFTAHCEGDPRAACAPKADDCVLCADGGWEVAAGMGVTPDLVLGDFDSSTAPAGAAVERFPVEKDDTDTMLCLKRGLSMGFDDFLIVGGFGGRLDHTLANLQALLYAKRRGARAAMADGESWATVIEGETLSLPRRPGHLSVFALDGACRGVTIRGAKYEVEDAALTNAFPLGVSNRFAADRAEISVREGALLVLCCQGR